MAKVVYDCHVVAICSSRNAEYVKQLGADEVIDYTTKDVAQTLLFQQEVEKKSDLIVDCVGGTELLGQYVNYFLLSLLVKTAKSFRDKFCTQKAPT